MIQQPLNAMYNAMKVESANQGNQHRSKNRLGLCERCFDLFQATILFLRELLCFSCMIRYLLLIVFPITHCIFLCSSIVPFVNELFTNGKSMAAHSAELDSP